MPAAKQTTEEITAYPLTWPNNWPRTASPSSSKFGKHTVTEALAAVRSELDRLRASNLIVSSNVSLGNQSPKDKGVAVYFNLRNLRCALACDRWSDVSHNLWAIAKHIESLRGQDRWGVGSIDQAFAGYAALPSPAGRDPWSLLGIRREGATREQVMTRFRTLAPGAHPDTGGTAEKFRELTAAKDLALANLPS